MHPWHDISIDLDRLGEAFPVAIEVPKGCKNKYELAPLGPADAITVLREAAALYGELRRGSGA